MQTLRPLAALSSTFACVAVTAAALTGCSFKSGPGNGPLPDAAALVKESAQTSATVTSAHLVLEVTGKVPGLPVKVLTGDLTTTPETAAKGNAQLNFMGQDISADFVVVDGHLYTNALSPGSPTMSDVGPASQLYDPSAILKPDTGIANVLSNFADPKAQGRDTVGGASAVHITGTVTADAVNKIAPPFRATKPVPADVWIQETGSHQLVRVKLESSPGNAVQMTLSKWGDPVQISKPSAI